MNDKSFEQIKNLIAVFRLLATKVQKDNQTKTKNLKEANQVLEACRKEYQKLHHENETLKKTIKQQEELQKYQDQLKNQPTCADRKKIIITLKDIEFDEDKSKKIFATQKKDETDELRIIPTKQILKVKMNLLTMTTAMIRLLSEKKKKH